MHHFPLPYNNSVMFFNPMCVGLEQVNNRENVSVQCIKISLGSKYSFAASLHGVTHFPGRQVNLAHTCLPNKLCFSSVVLFAAYLASECLDGQVDFR